MKNLTRTIAAMAAAALAGGAHASDHYVSATLNNLQIQVIDLSPGDKQAAGYTILGPTSYTEVESALSVGPGLLLDHYESFGFAPHDTAVGDGASSSRSSRGNGPFATFVAESRGYSYFVDTNFASAYSAEKLDFLVAPYTRLVFTGNYSLARTRSDDEPTELNSLAQVLVDMDDRWGTAARFYDRLPQRYEPDTALQQEKEGTFMLKFDAYFEEPLKVVFNASTIVAAPIPEPANWAMLLGGLGLLSLTSKAKSQGQRRKASFSV